MVGVVRLLPTLGAAALVVAGLIAGVMLLNSRDEASLAPAPTTPAQTTPAAARDLVPGNVAIYYRDRSDRFDLGEVASSLGAPGTPAARKAGQAIIVLHAPDQAEPLKLVSRRATMTADDPMAPEVFAFLREHLGRTD